MTPPEGLRPQDGRTPPGIGSGDFAPDRVSTTRSVEGPVAA